MKPVANTATVATAAAVTVDVRAANESIWADPLEYRAFPTSSTIDLTPAGRRLYGPTTASEEPSL